LILTPRETDLSIDDKNLAMISKIHSGKALRHDARIEKGHIYPMTPQLRETGGHE
jgi:hypothetical protein